VLGLALAIVEALALALLLAIGAASFFDSAPSPHDLSFDPKNQMPPMIPPTTNAEMTRSRVFILGRSKEGQSPSLKSPAIAEGERQDWEAHASS